MTKKTQDLDARIIDIESYTTGSGLRHTIVLVPNTGASRQTWWWFYGQTPGQIGAKASERGARVMDIDSYGSGANRRYTMVLQKNAGTGWYHYYNRTGAQVAALVAARKARIRDLEPRGGGRYDVVLEKAPAAAWQWWYGKTRAEVIAKADQYGQRIVSLSPDGSRYAALMVRNVAAETARIDAGMESAAGRSGYWGFYLRRLGGGTTHAINAGRPFEPASMLKALYELNAIHHNRDDLSGLDTDLTWYLGSSRSDDPSTADDERADGCPNGTLPKVDTHGEVIRRMMQRSDNRATEAIRLAYFGSYDNVNAYAASLGLTGTVVQHKIGCGTPPNSLTLVDAGRIYEKAADPSYLPAAAFARFRELSNQGRLWDAVVDQEAARAGLGAADVAAFKAAMRTVWKPGGYTVGGRGWSTIGGWVTVPSKVRGRVISRQYVFGAYAADNASRAVATTARQYGQAEVLRSTIRAALATW